MKQMMTLVAALSVVGTSFGAIRAVTPTAWNGKPDCWQMKRHQEKMAEVAKGGAKVVFIGDSITHFWETHGKEQLKKYFSEGDLKMLDLGTSADRTEHVLWRLDNGELDGYEAKAVFIMIGTNNAGHFSFADEPPSDTICGIREILARVRAKQPKATVVLTSIFPRGKDANDPIRRRNDVVNREIQKFCDGKSVFWLDFSDRYLQADGTLPKDLMPDFLHPRAPGYEIWHEMVKPYVDFALSDGKLPSPKNRPSPSAVPGTVRPADVAPATFPTTRIRIEGYGAKDWWLDRLLRNRNAIADAKGAIDIVFLGDSITHNWEGPGKDALAALRKTYSVLDAGYSGDRTEHLLWRVRNGELDGYKAKCIMVMIGTNNTWHRNDKAEDTAAGIRLILDTIAEKQPQAKVLLLPIFPIGDAATEKRRVRNNEVNAIIKGFADGEKVIWVDFGAKFLDEKGDTKWIMPDRVHPGPKGYEIWTDAVLPYFKAACGK